MGPLIIVLIVAVIAIAVFEGARCGSCRKHGLRVVERLGVSPNAHGRGVRSWAVIDRMRR